MIDRLKLIAKEISRGENLDLYLTILLAIVVSFLGVFGIVKFEIISAAILATLGLLASSLLTIRRSVRPTLDDLFNTRAQLPTFEEQLADAQSIDICGMSLLAVATQHRGFLLEKVARGCKIRLLLLNPDNESLMNMIAPFVTALTPEQYPTAVQQHTKAVEQHTKAIVTSLSFLTSEPILYNSVRLYDYPLAHAMLISNRNMPNGALRLEMYMHTRLPADAPGFYILRKDEPGWFNLFAAEFEAHWASATPIHQRMTTELNDFPS